MKNDKWKIILRLVLHGLSSLFEHLAIPDETSARIGSEFKILCQLKTVCRTGFLTQGAEHATRSVEDKFVEHLFATRFARDGDLDVHRQHVDTVFRTRERAQIACDAERV